MRRSPLIAIAAVVVLLPSGITAREPLKVERAAEEVTLTGYTRAKTIVELSSEVVGKLVERNYDIGQIIGDEPFFVIDTTFIDFQIDATRQSLRQLEVTLKMKRSRLGFLNKEYLRMRELFERNSAAGTKLDAAEQDFTQARLEVDATSVQIAQARTALSELAERRRRHRIFAPKGWSVSANHVEVGEIVSADTPLATVGDYRTLVVPLALSADEFTALNRLGESLTALLEGLSVEATVQRINPQFDEKTRKINLEIEIHGYAGHRRGGLRLALPLKVPTQKLQVPKTAVIDRYENPKVKIKSTGADVAVIVLGESGDRLIIADHPLLAPGIELATP
jgi:RND family efflux transporter MFP subunit